MERRCKIIELPADVGFLAYGATLAELFANTALAMCALACAPEKIEERIERKIFSRGANVESLLYAWLAEILTVVDAEQTACRRVDIIFFANLKKKNPERGAEFFSEKILPRAALRWHIRQGGDAPSISGRARARRFSRSRVLGFVARGIFLPPRRAIFFAPLPACPTPSPGGPGSR